MRKILFTLCFLLIVLAGKAQEKQRFDDAITNFKQLDQTGHTVKQGILFVGSSSFTFWKNLEQVFSKYQAINRGFGGSTLAELIYYADDIIYPYQPRQVVIYCGENDIAEGVSPEIAVDRFKTLFALVRKHLPQAKISYVSMKPSVARQNLMPQFTYANQLIKRYLNGKQNTSFIDVYPLMLQNNGAPLTDIFIQDNLHMNAKGYSIWVKAITPHLSENTN